jgi:hypothetical protein
VPSIAIMALLTGLGGSPMEALFAGHGAPLGGMATTYLLMSAFHSPQPASVYRSASGSPPVFSLRSGHSYSVFDLRIV